jgi:ribosomal protein S18 acetylase RimI-like enzyme
MKAPDVLIRLLNPADGAVLDAVAPEVFDSPVQPALVKEFLADPRHHLVVAIDDGVVVGFASGVHHVHPDKAAQLFVNEVGVAPSHRRRGIGRELVAALLARGRELGCVEAWVGTEPENVAARALYAAAGGVEDREPFVLVSFPLGPDGDRQATTIARASP